MHPRVAASKFQQWRLLTFLRNTFDQHWQPENRITHALITVLSTAA
jgi:hypothetical protein